MSENAAQKFFFYYIKRMPIKSPFCPGDKENFIFTLYDKQFIKEHRLEQAHFIMTTENVNEFWRLYLQNYFYAGDFLPNMNYQNNNKNLLSGMTFDEDIYIQVDEKSYMLTHVHCQDHKHKNNSCDLCKKEQALLQTDLEKLQSEDEIQRYFIQWIKKNPYQPNANDFNIIQNMCQQLINFINDNFQQKLSKYTVLCRNNIRTDLSDIKTCKTIYQTDNSYKHFYRYGFHIYFFEYTFDIDGKKFIKDKFQFSNELKADIKKIYPQSQLNEVFDKCPLVGSVSLPLSGGKDKVYLQFYDSASRQIIGFKEPGSAAIQKLQKETLESLNPFIGPFNDLQSKNKKLNKASLVDYFKNKPEIDSYNKSIIQVKEDVKFELASQKNIELLVYKYGHPSFEYRQQIMRNLIYKYYIQKDKKSQLYIQKLFYLIMCEDIDECCANETADIYDKDWMQANQERNRYPIQVSKLYDITLETILKEGIKESYIGTINLIKGFNNYQVKIGSELRISETELESTQPYQNFNDFIITYQNGMFKDSFYDDMLGNSKFKSTINEIFLQFLISQLKSGLYVHSIGRMKEMFQFCGSENGFSSDYNKYHYLGPEDLCAQIFKIFDQIKNGISNVSCQILTLHPAIKEDVQELLQILSEQRAQNKKQGYYMTDEQIFMQANCDSELVKEYGLYLKLIHSKSFFNACCDQKQILTKGIGYNGTLYDILYKQHGQNVMDQMQNVFGVYNGIIQWCEKEHKFTFYTEEDSKKFSVSKSTLFQIRPEFINEDGTLKEIDDLPDHYRQIYNDIVGIFNTIYFKGRHIDVLHWKIFQILKRMLDKTIPGEQLLISYGTGSDGKTTAMQAICNALGQGSQNFTWNNSSRKLENSGYTAQSKSTILQTKASGANSHDSGGMSELQGKYFALMTELASSQPLVASAIKTMLCGSQINARKAYSSAIESFQNQCFLELQTNYYPGFDQPLDDGLIRRILVYSHVVKFKSVEEYNKIPEDQRSKFAIGDENVRNNLTSNFEYLDVLGYYMLKVYEIYEHRDISYIPDVIKQNTKQFISQSSPYMRDCISALNIEQDTQITWNQLQDKVKQIIDQKLGKRNAKTKAEEAEQQINNHLKKIRELYINQIYVVSREKEYKKITENEFENYEKTAEFLIVVKGFSFIDDTLQEQSDLEFNDFIGKYKKNKKHVEEL